MPSVGSRPIRQDAAEKLRLCDGTPVEVRSPGHGDDAPGSWPQRRTLAAEVNGRTVGTAGFRRVYGPRAVVELTVDDPFWHRGLPEVLLASLCVQAAALGISSFVARVPAADVRLLALLRVDFLGREWRDGPYVEVEFSTALD